MWEKVTNSHLCVEKAKPTGTDLELAVLTFRANSFPPQCSSPAEKASLCFNWLYSLIDFTLTLEKVPKCHFPFCTFQYPNNICSFAYTDYQCRANRNGQKHPINREQKIKRDQRGGWLTSPSANKSSVSWFLWKQQAPSRGNEQHSQSRFGFYLPFPPPSAAPGAIQQQEQPQCWEMGLSPHP